MICLKLVVLGHSVVSTSTVRFSTEVLLI